MGISAALLSVASSLVKRVIRRSAARDIVDVADAGTSIAVEVFCNKDGAFRVEERWLPATITFAVEGRADTSDIARDASGGARVPCTGTFNFKPVKKALTGTQDGTSAALLSVASSLAKRAMRTSATRNFADLDVADAGPSVAIVVRCSKDGAFRVKE